MQNLEIQARQDLENNIPYDYCRSCDSSDGLYHEWPDEDSWQYRIKMLLEEKDKEIEELEQKEIKYQKEIEKLNDIVNRFEKDIFGMYVDIIGCTEDYARKLIEEIKEGGISGNLEIDGEFNPLKRLNNIMQFVENAVIIGGHGYEYRKAIGMLYEGCEYNDVLNWYSTQIGAEQEE